MQLHSFVIPTAILNAALAMAVPYLENNFYNMFVLAETSLTVMAGVYILLKTK